MPHFEEFLPDICSAVLVVMERTLPPTLTYHSVQHTRDVLYELNKWTMEDEIPFFEREMLYIAASFHDSGFLDSPDGHESHGAERARKAMESTGRYAAEEIALVEQMIMDTQVKHDIPERGPCQVPHSPLSGYLLDADMSNLGRSDFSEKTGLLAKERGVNPDDIAFLQGVLSVVRAKVWYCPAAQRHRTEVHKQNLASLEHRVSQMLLRGRYLLDP